MAFDVTEYSRALRLRFNRRSLSRAIVLNLSCLVFLFETFASAQVAVTANVPTYNFQVLAGSTRQINVNITGGTLNTINWSVLSSTGGASATFTDTTHNQAASISGALPTIQVNIGAVQGNCSISGSTGSYSVSSTATVTVQAQSTDSLTATSTFLFNVCSNSSATLPNGQNSVIVAPAYQQAFQSQPMSLQSWVVGCVDETGTWSITSQPAGASVTLPDMTNRDALFPGSTVIGRYSFKYTSNCNGGSNTAIIYVSPNAMPSWAASGNTEGTEPRECYADPALTGPVIQIGAGKAYTTISSVPPITAVVPGTLYQLFNTDTTGSNPSTFYEYFQIQQSGTPTQPIWYCGVADKNGNLPIMDGNNATAQSDLSTGAAAGYGIFTLWMAQPHYGYWQDAVTPTQNAGNSVMAPAYVGITGIHVRNASPSYNYVPPGGGAPVAWVAGASGINLRSGIYVDFDGNDIDNNSNGTFLAENSDNSGWVVNTYAITIRGNHIHNSGIAGSATYHQLYVQCFYCLLEGNRIDNYNPQASGSMLKWRGVEGLIRYNYIGDGAQRVVDLVEVQDAGCYVSFELYLSTACGLYSSGDSLGANLTWYQESLQKDFVYGNMLYGASALNQIHYAMDNLGNMTDRNGILYFWNNTLDSAAIVFSIGENNDGLNSYLRPRVNAQNNILWAARTSGMNSTMQMADFQTAIITAQTNLLTTLPLGYSYTANPIPIVGTVSYSSGTAYGWPIGCDLTCLWPNSAPMNTHTYGLTDANFLNTATQPYNSTTMVPITASAAIGASSAVTGLPAQLPVRYEFNAVNSQLYARTRTGAGGDVGAQDGSGSPPPPPIVAATPTFSPRSGTYSSAQSVTISTTTPSATIYYTTDGSTPTTGSAVYSGPITVSATETVEAIAVASGDSNSSTGSAVYTIGQTQAATPAFSPGTGSYSSAQTVTISSATPSATIYYTTNGSTPTTSSAVYSGPIAVSATETVEAVATASGFSTSSTGSAAYTIYTISGGGVVCPTGSTSSSSWSQLSLPAAMTTGSATISSLFASKNCYLYVSMYSNGTWEAKVSDLRDHPTSTSNWTEIDSGFPAATLNSGTANVDSWVEDSAGNIYAGIGEVGLGLSCPTCVVGKWNGSTWTFSTNPSGIKTEPRSLQVDASNNVYLSDLDADFWESTNGGSTFTSLVTDAYTAFGQTSGLDYAMTLYNGQMYWGGEGAYMQSPANMSSGTVMWASTASGYGGNAQVIVGDGTASTSPTYLLAASRILSSGPYSMSRYVVSTNTWTDLGSASGIPTNTKISNKALFGGIAHEYLGGWTTNIYRSTDDGQTWSVFSTGLPSGEQASDKQIAISPWDDSFYTATDPTPSGQHELWVYPKSSTTSQAATPIFTPVSGTYNSAQTVTISTTTPSATIYYTTNGSTPTTGSAVYSGPITVSATETVEAIAVASGYSNSSTGSAAYTIGLTPAATPTFSPAAGSYSSAQTVTISSATPSATIYYTTNGSTPTTSSAVYSGPINVSATETVEAIATASGFSTSSTGSAAYTINSPQAATPTFSPVAGTYKLAQTVTVSTTTPSATIYYTTNGSTPTTSSAVYSGPITVAATQTIQVIATASGYSNSSVGSAAYTINLAHAATPTFSPSAGTYNSAQTVTISTTTPSATIYYTTNGSTPTTSSTVYSGPITVSASETVQAISLAAGYTTSDPGTSTYTISTVAVTPTFSPAAGTYTAAQTVTISTTTPSATIYYTTNGSTPTTSSAVYSGPITVSATETVEAIAAESGYTTSAVSSAAYTINLTQTATPNFSPAPGTYSSTQTVAIASVTPSAAIYYTTDGSTPTTSSTVYSGPITVSATETVQAIATATGLKTSATGIAAYTIAPSAAVPTFSPAAGTYSSAQTVTISTTTPSATIYYTTNGSTPTTSSAVYSGPFTVSSTETLKAIAVASGHLNSTAGTAVYSINYPPASAPTFSPGAGTYSTVQTVAISSATPAAIIYYTTNGSTPTTSSPAYSVPITVSATETVKAISIATGYTLSAAVSAAYTINFPPAATPTFSPGTGTYNAAQTVTISSATPGMTIYYTTNGSAPTTGSAVYSGPITVSATETVEAIAVAQGRSSSAAASAAFTINITPAAPPTFNPGAGTYDSAQVVTISTTTPGAAIYYTTDGSTPTMNSALYSSPITVSSTETLEAISVAPTTPIGQVNSSVTSYTQSAVGMAAYVLNLPLPNFSVAVSPGLLDVVAGQSSTTTVMVTPLNSFSSPVTFSCSGLPAGASCSFSPGTVTPSHSGAAASTTLTVTTSTTTALVRHGSSPLFPGSALALAVCCFGLRKRRGFQLMLFALVALGMSLCTGCSLGVWSNTQPTPQAQSSTVTVVATSGALQPSTTFTLTVQ
jgi:hypothetical protein